MAKSNFSKAIAVFAMVFFIAAGMTACDNSGGEGPPTGEFTLSFDMTEFKDYISELDPSDPNPLENFRITAGYIGRNENTVRLDDQSFDAGPWMNTLDEVITNIEAGGYIDPDKTYEVPRDAMLLGVALVGIVPAEDTTRDPEFIGSGESFIIAHDRNIFNDTYNKAIASSFTNEYNPVNFNHINDVKVIGRVGGKVPAGEANEEEDIFFFDVLVNGRLLTNNENVTTKMPEPPRLSRSLQGTTTLNRRYHNYVFDDVKKAVDNIKRSSMTGRSIYCSEGTYKNPGVTEKYHINGFEVYHTADLYDQKYKNDNWYIMNHSGNNSYGKLFFSQGYSGGKTREMQLILNSDKSGHPGGMQRVGDFLFVPAENSSSSGYIFVYDLQGLKNNDKAVCKYMLTTPDDYIGSIGVVNVPTNVMYSGLTSQGSSALDDYNKLIMIRHDGGKSKKVKVSYTGLITNALFENGGYTLHHSDITINFDREAKYDNMRAFLDKNDDIWLFGFHSESVNSSGIEGSSGFNDYLHVWQLTRTTGTDPGGRTVKEFITNPTCINSGYTKIDFKHSTGNYTHESFRYGAGLIVTGQDDHFFLFGTARNFPTNAGSKSDHYGVKYTYNW